MGITTAETAHRPAVTRGSSQFPASAAAPTLSYNSLAGDAACPRTGVIMRRSLESAALLAILAMARSGEYCDDFEDGDLGPVWTTNSDLDSRGQWEVSSYQQLKSSIPDFPAPARGDSVAYLTPMDPYQVYVYARLQMSEEYVFPEGSSVSFRYWLRTDYPGSGTLEVRQQIRGVEEKEPLISLTETSGPNNTQWKEVNVSIPASTYGQKVGDSQC